MSKPKLTIISTPEDEHSIVRPERNIDRIAAIWTPSSDRSESTTKVIEYEIDLEDKKIQARLEIIPAVRNVGGKHVHMLLTTFDQKVFLALIKLWEEQGKPDEFALLSLRRLAREIGLKWGGETIRVLESSLYRLTSVTLDLKQFVAKKGTKLELEILEPIRILTELKIIKRKVNGEISKEKGYFRFHSAILSNIKANYTRPVLFDVVCSFKSDIAQLIYTLIDRELYGEKRKVYRIRSERLFSEIGLTGKEHRYRSSRKRTLERALKDLIGKPLSSAGVVSRAELEPTKDGKDFNVIFEKGPRLKSLPPESPEAGAEELVAYFYRSFFGVQDGVRPGKKELQQASHLISMHGFDQAKAVIDTAKEEAPKTNFDIKTFGGVMQYQAQALGDAARRREQDRPEQGRNEWDRLRETFISEYQAYLKPELEQLSRKNGDAFGEFDRSFMELIGGVAVRRKLTPESIELWRLIEFEDFVSQNPGLGIRSFPQWIQESHPELL
ncbi:MAG TPA: hypothetical protein VJ302_34295 [Blastocatellia bacterium]|nr:hypothetical protein [Blastocatellia bacterium]